MTEKRGVSRAELKRFKREYLRNLREGNESFKFEGNEYFTRYAKYMVEYLEGINPKKK